jgi:hypothetical protein
MHHTTKPVSFNRYSEAKYSKFQQWLGTHSGGEIYRLFRQYASMYLKAGRSDTQIGAALVANRVRWETATVIDYANHKVPNDFIPMMARQLELDEPATFGGFFTSHRDKVSTSPAPATQTDLVSFYDTYDLYVRPTRADLVKWVGRDLVSQRDEEVASYYEDDCDDDA